MSTKCLKCEKTVYPMEATKVDGQTFHKRCFKCKQCKTNLSAGTCAMINAVPFCKTCFKKMFAESGGSYDRAFGDGGRFKMKPTGTAAGNAMGSVAKTADATSATEPVTQEEEPAVVEETPTVAEEEQQEQPQEEQEEEKIETLVERMQRLQAAAATPENEAPVQRKSTGATARFASANTSNKCGTCSTTVYPLEATKVDGQVFHKRCFKCKQCKTNLSAGTCAMINAVPFCKTCFKKMFAESGGSYDRAFGDGGRFKMKPTGTAAGNALASGK
ncbi:MAG: hypothetical protein MHM6MM_004227 [Cercozoa sp. M6MM]